MFTLIAPEPSSGSVGANPTLLSLFFLFVFLSEEEAGPGEGKVEQGLPAKVSVVLPVQLL